MTHKPYSPHRKPDQERHHEEHTMSQREALRRQSERTSPIAPNEPPTGKKHEARGQRAEGHSDTILDQLRTDARERPHERGAADLSAGYPGTAITSGNESNAHNPDASASDAHPQP